MAASQCTMNNFTFGNASYQYYETISGGSGAGEGYNGTSVVQTHMTNSRLTDPEVLEFRFPVRLLGYEIRRGSGGAGRWHGGDGGVRRVQFLEAMTASILSNGRSSGAFVWPAGRAASRASTAWSAPTVAWRNWGTSARRRCSRGCVRDPHAGWGWLRCPDGLKGGFPWLNSRRLSGTTRFRGGRVWGLQAFSVAIGDAHIDIIMDLHDLALRGRNFPSTTRWHRRCIPCANSWHAGGLRFRVPAGAADLPLR